MRKSIGIWPVLGLLMCMLVAFLWYGSDLTNSLNEAEERFDQGRVRLMQLEYEQSRLKDTLEVSGTDAFIENQARMLYGYMKPEEMRFVITNPEVLYGPGGIPVE